MTTPRTRFAPAPSGWLHVGSARTALYNWLHVRSHGGSFVLRVEDTDADRVTDESLTAMVADLHWLGLEWDEGPDPSKPLDAEIGPRGPYRQSRRAELHRAVARALVEAGHAYEAFETPEELEEQRRAQVAAGRPAAYKRGHRELSDAQRAAYRGEGRQPVVRVRTPDQGTVKFTDLVRGEVSTHWAEIGDFVILRADGSPTYQLANVVDDLAQGITLICRGEDLVSATPRQLLMADLLLADGLLDSVLSDMGAPPRPEDAPRPQYAHLPLLVGEDRKPLSKRHGSVAVGEFARAGFLPDVMLNFLALCGWSYDGARERFSKPELIEVFSFDRVGRTPSFFDTDKLRSLNGDAIRQLDDDDLASRLQPYLAEVAGGELSDEQRRLLRGLTPLVKERIQTLAEAPGFVGFAFRHSVEWDEKATAKWLKGPAAEVLERAQDDLVELDWDADALMAYFQALADELGVGLGKVMQPVRVAVTGTAVSPPLPEMLAVLDRELVRQRIAAARPLVRAG